MPARSTPSPPARPRSWPRRAASASASPAAIRSRHAAARAAERLRSARLRAPRLRARRRRRQRHHGRRHRRPARATIPANASTTLHVTLSLTGLTPHGLGHRRLGHRDDRRHATTLRVPWAAATAGDAVVNLIRAAALSSPLRTGQLRRPAVAAAAAARRRPGGSRARPTRASRSRRLRVSRSSSSRATPIWGACSTSARCCRASTASV